MLRTTPKPPGHWAQFTPKLITAMREGYGLRQFRADAMAGLTVAVIALPLAMALGVASGASPDKGLLQRIDRPGRQVEIGE